MAQLSGESPPRDDESPSHSPHPKQPRKVTFDLGVDEMSDHQCASKAEINDDKTASVQEPLKNSTQRSKRGFELRKLIIAAAKEEVRKQNAAELTEPSKSTEITQQGETGGLLSPVDPISRDGVTSNSKIDRKDTPKDGNILVATKRSKWAKLSKRPFEVETDGKQSGELKSTTGSGRKGIGPHWEEITERPSAAETYKIQDQRHEQNYSSLKTKSLKQMSVMEHMTPVEHTADLRQKVIPKSLQPGKEDITNVGAANNGAKGSRTDAKTAGRRLKPGNQTETATERETIQYPLGQQIPDSGVQPNGLKSSMEDRTVNRKLSGSNNDIREKIIPKTDETVHCIPWQRGNKPGHKTSSSNLSSSMQASSSAPRHLEGRESPILNFSEIPRVPCTCPKSMRPKVLKKTYESSPIFDLRRSKKPPKLGSIKDQGSCVWYRQSQQSSSDYDSINSFDVFVQQNFPEPLRNKVQNRNAPTEAQCDCKRKFGVYDL